MADGFSERRLVVLFLTLIGFILDADWTVFRTAANFSLTVIDTLAFFSRSLLQAHIFTSTTACGRIEMY